MTLIPIVVLLREDRYDALHRITNRTATDRQLDMWADRQAEHGWTDQALVAGTILSNALAITDEAEASKGPSK